MSQIEKDSEANTTNTTNTANLDKPNLSIPFWSNDPNILFQQNYIFEFFATENMSYEQKLNAITRSVIILTIIGF